MRLKNSIKNVFTGIGEQVLSLILGFISRSVFLLVLNTAYLGVSGLFSSILTLLSLAELGVGSAIVYSLYKPLAEKDEEKILAFMDLYKRAYHIIGTVILLVGLSFTPFIHLLVKEVPDIDHFRLIYMLYAANSAITYFFSYNRSLITADQKAYKLALMDYAFKMVFFIVPSVVLLVTHNFITYLVFQIVIRFVQNLVVYLKVNRVYPVLQKKDRSTLSLTDKKLLKKNVFALMIYKLSGVTATGIDNIIISRFFGIAAVGLYANYLLIITSIRTILSQALNSLIASIGNLSVTESDEKNYDIFKVIQFAGFWVYGFCSIGLLVLINPFITIWLGKEYLFDMANVLPLSIGFYVIGMQSVVSIFREAQGLFWQGKLRPLMQAIANIVLSVILVKLTENINAVFWGAVISRLVTSVWFDPYVVHKHGFHRSVWSYYKKYIIYFLILAISAVITFFTASMVGFSPFINLIIMAVLCLIIPNAIFLLCFWKTNEFGYIIDTIINICKSLRLKKSKTTTV